MKKLTLGLFILSSLASAHETFVLKNRSLDKEIRLECHDIACEEVLIKLYENNEYQDDIFFSRLSEESLKDRSQLYPTMQALIKDIKNDWQQGQRTSSILWSLFVPFGYAVESISIPQTLILKNIKSSCEYNFKIAKKTFKQVEKAITRKTDLTLSDKSFNQVTEVFFSTSFLLETTECLSPIVINQVNDQIRFHSTPVLF